MQWLSFFSPPFDGRGWGRVESLFPLSSTLSYRGKREQDNGLFMPAHLDGEGREEGEKPSEER